MYQTMLLSFHSFSLPFTSFHSIVSLDDMFLFELVDYQFDGLFGAHLEGLAGGLELLGERLEDARGRAGLADMLLGDVDAVGTPHLNLFVEGGDDAVDGHVAGLHAGGQGGDDAGGLHLEHLVAVLELFLDGEGLGGLVVLEVLHVGDLRQVEVLGDLGTHLGGVAVDSLAAGDDEVDIHGAQGAGEGAAGGQRIGTAELAVGEQDGAVDTHGEGLAEDGLGLGQTHGDDGDVGTVLVLQLQGVLKTALVVGVHDRGNALADEALISYPINAQIGVWGVIGAMFGGTLTAGMAQKHLGFSNGDVLGTSNEIGRLFSLLFMIFAITTLI